MSQAASAPGPPARTRLGLLLPGLGHVLTGDLRNGVPMVVDTLVLVAAAALGLPRLGALLFPPPTAGGFALHPWLALVTWFAAVALLWRAAVRLSFPPRPVGARARSQTAIVARQFARHRLGMLGLHGVLLLGLLALLTPWLAPYNPDQLDAGPHMLSPTLRHPLGTDDFGRDLLSRLLYGARISLSIGFLAVAISATFGSLWGAVSGYLGGTYDVIMVWVVDFLLSLPRLVLVLTIVGIYRPRGVAGLYVIIFVLGMTGWMSVSRIVRGVVLSLKEQDFIQAARAIGQTGPMIVLRHLLPNALAPVIVHASLGIGVTILTEAGLSFLGLGVPPPISTWGSIISDGREFLRSAPWITTFPGLLIVFAVMSFNLVGDGLRDALDPKLRSR